MIPNGITTINQSVFSYCSSLESITIPGSVTSIGYECFLGCDSLESIVLPNNVDISSADIPDSATQIKYTVDGDNVKITGATAGTKKISLVIPEKIGGKAVIAIYDSAFSSCTNLESIFIPNSLDVSSAFIPDSATQIKYTVDDKGNATIVNIVLGGDQTSFDIPKAIGGKAVTDIADGALVNCPDVKHTHREMTAATCTEKPVCSICGQGYDEPLGHSFTNYVSNNDATCTENGTETAKCDHCDKTDTRERANSALGHSFTKYVSDNNATCTENGTETAKCDHCDKTDTREEADSALEHDHSGDWQNNDTEHWKVCARKDCTELLDKSAHKYDSGVITTPATEEKEGVKTYTCETCKHTKTEPIAKLEAKIALPKATATAGVNSVSLKWNAVDGAKSYRAFYRVNGTKAWTPKNTPGTSVTITDLTGGTKYDFLVLAYDGTNWSKYTNSDIINATPKTAVVTPAKPVFTATAGVNSISLKWNAVSGAASYRVYYRVNGTTAWKYRNTTATAVTLTDLTGGTKYDFAVRAYSGSAWSAFSTRDIVNATPLVAGKKPVFSSVTPGVNRAILRWNSVDGAKSYRVFYRVSGTLKWSYKNTTLTAMNLTGLEGGKTYEFVVRAYNGSAWTAYSSADIVKATVKN